MEKLKIVLKNGEVKKYPWNDISTEISDERVRVGKRNSSKTLIFRAPASNVEYCEVIEEDEEEEENPDGQGV